MVDVDMKTSFAKILEFIHSRKDNPIYIGSQVLVSEVSGTSSTEWDYAMSTPGYRAFEGLDAVTQFYDLNYYTEYYLLTAIVTTNGAANMIVKINNIETFAAGTWSESKYKASLYTPFFTKEELGQVAIPTYGYQGCCVYYKGTASSNLFTISNITLHKYLCPK